ncbi:unnamed protein product [Closterium sp. NIES-53]
MSNVLIAEGLGYNLLSVSQLMAKRIHLEAGSTTQEFKLYNGRGGLYIGKAVLKNNVFVIDFVPDQGTADSDAIVNFTTWSHPPDLDPDLQRVEDFLPERDLTGGFRGNRAFASSADEADWDEQNVVGASEEAGPLPYYSVLVPMDDENPRESINAEVYYDFADNGYVTPQPVNMNVSERIGPNFLPDPEAGDKAFYPEDPNLPRYTQSGLQILGLVTAVHCAPMP